MRQRKKVYRILVGTPERKRQLRRPRSRWRDIKTDLREIGWNSLSWIDLAQDRGGQRALVNAVMKPQVP
jgi:hypothetical protein